MKLIQLLLEIEFRTYEAMVQIRFKEEVDGGYDDAIRAFLLLVLLKTQATEPLHIK